MRCAAANSARSPFALPMICAPTGKPCGPLKTGIVTDGTCSVVQIRQLFALPVALSPTGASPVADAVTYQRIDSHTIKGVAKKAGKAVVRETVVVSKDGKILTGTYSGTDATGKGVTGIAVFEKQ